jgi:hypothetical protein
MNTKVCTILAAICCALPLVAFAQGTCPVATQDAHTKELSMTSTTTMTVPAIESRIPKRLKIATLAAG